MNSGNLSLAQLDPDKTLSELDRIDSEESLSLFIQRSWHLLEPGRRFVHGWCVDAISEHLFAIHTGEITRLIMNVPPGFMKSLTTNVFFPAWEWGPKHRPDMRYISASYSRDLTIRDNRRARTLMESNWYKRKWGINNENSEEFEGFTLVSDQNAKTRYDTNHMGFKIATSVGGLGTGERGDRFIIDDPHNVKEGESEKKRDAVLLWLNEVVPTRLNDYEVSEGKSSSLSSKPSAIIIVMQRVHEKDCSAEAIKKELGYEQLMIPMRFESERKCFTSIGWEDPRKKDGALAWPERFSEKTVTDLEKALGSYGAAGQLQQRPAPRGGGMFKKAWFEIVPEKAASVGRVVRGWDLAASEGKDSPYTVGVLMSKDKEGYIYVEDVVRFKGSPYKVERALKNTASQDGHSTEVDLPQDPGQAGKAQIAYLKRQLAGFTVRSSSESGDKEKRAEPFASQAEAGNVRIVRGDWNEAYLDELIVFPNSEFKDQMDATSRAFSRLTSKKVTRVGAAPEAIAIV